MRRTLLIISVLFFSCQSPSPVKQLHVTLTGDWLILYPDHELTNGRQRDVYGRMQDSIVGLKGLKLISFDDNGTFRQADSLDTRGRWGITGERKVFIEDGGKGFEHYEMTYISYEKKILKLTEFIEGEGEKIKLVWHLKKITGREETKLFSADRNAWRKRPGTPETETEMKKRLSEMLQYYAGYYQLVTKEASYFVPARVILPFHFYQHAMGVETFDETGEFARLFYSKEQAEQAHHYLSIVLKALSDDFPSKDNYVEEYAAFMGKMAEQMIK